MRKAVLALCGLSLLGGCGGSVKPASSDHDQGETSIPEWNVAGPMFQVRTDGYCSRVNSKTLSPSIAEWSNFVSRLDSEKKRITIGINLNCIRKLYTKQEISNWKDDGDPVAIMTFLDDNYKDYKSVCNNYDYIKTLLNKAQSVKVKISKESDFIMRVPEAYIASADIDYECRGIGYKLFSPEDLASHDIREFFLSIPVD
jgi:uncharacterized protein YeeX (DUF496 family)